MWQELFHQMNGISVGSFLRLFSRTANIVYRHSLSPVGTSSPIYTHLPPCVIPQPLIFLSTHRPYTFPTGTCKKRSNSPVPTGIRTTGLFANAPPKGTIGNVWRATVTLLYSIWKDYRDNLLMSLVSHVIQFLRFPFRLDTNSRVNRCGPLPP